MTMKKVILRRVESPRTRMRQKGVMDTVERTPYCPFAVEVDDVNVQRTGEIARKKDVEAIAPVVPIRLIQAVAVDPLSNLAANATPWGIESIGAETSPYSGNGVTIAVLDTGIDSEHPTFAGINLVRKNFTRESDEDLDGHGTHCAGTIFGRPIGGIRIGVAPGITTALIGKVVSEGRSRTDVLLTAIEWALQKGAHVISMSLGIDFPGFVVELQRTGIPTELATSMALEGYRANVLLFERLASLVRARSPFLQPCVIVAAAGNESRRDENPDFVIAVSPPAAAEGIVSVAALGSEPRGLTIASFSNSGARLAAPGVDILSAKRGGGLTAMSGTSMATPHVAGVAALWAEKLQTSRQFSGRLFIDRLVGSGTMIGLKPDFDPVDVGSGIVRAPQD